MDVIIKNRIFFGANLFCGLLLLMPGCSCRRSEVVYTVPNDPTLTPSLAITYSSPLSYFTKGVAMTAITPAVTGAPVSFAVWPTLPAGVIIDSLTGVISGMPTVAIPPTTFTVMGHTNEGATATATVNFEIAIPFTVSTTADAVDQTPGDQICQTAASACSLRAALDEANALTGILSLISLPAGTYVAASTLNINARVILTGASAATSIISGNNSLNRIIRIGNYTVSMENFAVKGGYDAGSALVEGLGIYSVSDNLTLKNCEVSNHNLATILATVNFNGLSMKLDSAAVTSRVFIDNCVVSNNTFSGPIMSGSNFGIGAYIRANTVTIQNSTFQANNSSAGSGGAGQYVYGGGLFLNAVANLTITATTISNNVLATSAQNDRGGGLYIQGAGSVHLFDRLTCDSNEAPFGGGCIWYGATGNVVATILNSSVTNNLDGSNDGGGFSLATTAASIIIDRSYFDTGVAGSTPFLARTGSKANITAKNSTFVSYSGVIPVSIGSTSASAASFENCTLFSAAGSAPALFKAFSGVVTISFKNSIIDGDGGASCLGQMAAITSLGYNLSSDASCSFFVGASGDATNTASGLLAPASNGGLTKTMAIGAGAATRDAVPLGSCAVTADQRGVMRPQGGACDIGAYEYQ